MPQKDAIRFDRLNTIVTTRKRSLRRLCFHRCLSVHGGVSIQGVSVQEGLCPDRSLSRGVFVQGGLCPGGLCGCLCPGGLCPEAFCLGGLCSRGVSVQGSLCQGEYPMVMSRWYASYWNAFFLGIVVGQKELLSSKIKKKVMVPRYELFSSEGMFIQKILCFHQLKHYSETWWQKGTKKYDIFMYTFGDHLFLDLFYSSKEGHSPLHLDPLPLSCPIVCWLTG